MGKAHQPCRLGSSPSALLPVAFVDLGSAADFSVAAALAFALLYGMSNGLVTIAKGAVPLHCSAPGYGEMLGTLRPRNSFSMPWRRPCSPCFSMRTRRATGLVVCFAFALLSLAAMVQLARPHPRCV